MPFIVTKDERQKNIWPVNHPGINIPFTFDNKQEYSGFKQFTAKKRSMEKTVFTIKGTLPGEYISNIVEWDLNEGKLEQKDLSYVENSYKGRIWIDGIEIHADYAMKLRPGFSEEKWNFSWGYTSHIVRITSLAICLDLFKDEEFALNLYLPFMHEFLDGLKIESFEKRIDITDFLIDHRSRLTGRFFTRYFEFSYFGNHEINIIHDEQTKKFTVNLLDQICRDLVDKEIREMKRPTLASLFSKKHKQGKKAEAEFDRLTALEVKKKELQEFFFRPYNSFVSECSLKNAIKYSGVILKNYYGAGKEELREKSKDLHEKILAFRAKEALKIKQKKRHS